MNKQHQNLNLKIMESNFTWKWPAPFYLVQLADEYCRTKDGGTEKDKIKCASVSQYDLKNGLATSQLSILFENTNTIESVDII